MMKIIVPFIVFVVFDTSLACSCNEGTSDENEVIKRKFCNAKLVTWAEVTAKTPGETRFDNVLYTIKADKVYKAAQGEKEGSIIEVKSASSDAVCGVMLEVGKRYLLTAGIRNGMYYSQMCEQLVTPRNNLQLSVFEEYIKKLSNDDLCP
ncbi:hypothetical protein AB6A40_008597 [Gnathostoma spinigerum]|uniref:NTR domain-containing protein n=1 Tax=Gnathostoma spinigerum TaxID=75299 RepID=A0ABD6EPU7_9BILA